MRGLIPFYGASERDLFRLEREAMDRSGKVIAWLDANLPAGRVLDIGAGDGFTARKLRRGDREVVCVEPSEGMIDRGAGLTWVRATAQELPFHDGTYDAAYATWAYFLPGIDKEPGLAELERVVRPGGRILIATNAGGDDLAALAGAREIAGEEEFYSKHGFQREVVETAFEFETAADAERLMTRYFGQAPGPEGATPTTYSFRVATYRKGSDT